MILFEEACCDRDLYSAWLLDRHDATALADRAGQLLSDGGFSVPHRFRDALGAIPPVELADFIATNSPFDTDEGAWLEYCHRRFATAHPSEPAAQRNGARSTWRI